MKKNEQQLKDRREFINACYEDPDKAVDILREKARKIYESNGVVSTTRAVSDLLFLHENTILNDYMSTKD